MSEQNAAWCVAYALLACGLGMAIGTTAPHPLAALAVAGFLVMLGAGILIGVRVRPEGGR